MTFPFNPGDVVVLNSSPNVPMTVIECIDIHEKDHNGDNVFGVNVTMLDIATNKPITKGFKHNTLSLFIPRESFPQNPIGYKQGQDD
jgi:hypothetical protein